MNRNTKNIFTRRFLCNTRLLMIISILFAIHLASVALALDKPDNVPILQSTTLDNGSANNGVSKKGAFSRNYLKKHGDKWFQVTRGTGALSDTIVPASEPMHPMYQSAVSDGSGIFAPYVNFPVGSWPEAVAIGDVNGDGRNDVVMTTSFYFDDSNDYKLFVFLQNSSGTLDSPVKYSTHGTYSKRPATVAIGDINNDGKNDVVVGLDGGGLDVFIQNSEGELDSAIVYTGSDSSKIRIADLNHDGLLDVVGAGSGHTASVWLQNAAGALNAPVTYNVTYGGFDDLEVGDVNNDGLQDIIVMSGSSLADNMGILLQQPDGTFGSPVYYNIGGNILTRGVAVGDVNGDNRNDVVVSYGGNSPDAHVGSFLQNASATLDPAVSHSSYDCPEAIEIKDVNNSGRNDVIVAHGGWTALGVYLQKDDGALMSESLYTIPYASHYNPHGLAVGDINGDGGNDVVLADYNNGLVVLYNRNDNAAKISTSYYTTGITSTTAISGGNITSDGGLTVTKRGVCWNTTGNPTTGDTCTTDGSGIGVFRSDITGLTPSTLYYVRAYATNSGGTYYGNKRTFVTSAAIPSINVTSPNGNEVWVAGDVHPITWSHTGATGAKARIQLYKGSSLKKTIASGVSMSAGSYRWTIADTLQAGTDYRIKITSATNAKISDMSDKPFTINTPTIAVTSPNGGEVLSAGSVIPITWSYTGYAGNSNAKIAIQLYKGKSLYKTITTSAALSAKTFSWTVPTLKTGGTNYRIKVAIKTNSKVSDMSDNYFSIGK